MRPLLRILITGSREWDDADTVGKIFEALPPRSIVVHGGAAGADEIANALAKAAGHEAECHPVSPETWKRVGKAAGPIRNQKMVDLGADLCLAFPRSGSRGTWDCVRRAKKAGIPTTIILGQHDVHMAVSRIREIAAAGSFWGWTATALGGRK